MSRTASSECWILALYRRLLILLLVGGITSASLLIVTGPARAQTPPEERSLTERERTAIRWLYRARPDFAKELQKALSSASSDSEQQQNLIELRRRIREVREQEERIPKSLRQDNWELGMRFSEYILGHVHDDRLPTNILATEDDIIAKAPFKNYEELYDFLRTTRPSDFGQSFIGKMDTLRKKDTLQYLEAMHRLIDERDEYRARNGPAKVIRIDPGDAVKVEDRAAGVVQTKPAENRSARPTGRDRSVPRPAQPVRP